MLLKENQQLESNNFVDGVDFTKDDPCLFVVYPAGCSGDLLISIIDKHYIRTGCEYYGINDVGRAMMFSTDYNSLDKDRNYAFTEQWFYDLADHLASRNLNYSLLDQVIFGCHYYEEKDVNWILDTFPNAKIIRIRIVDDEGNKLRHDISKLKVLKQYQGTHIDNQPVSTPIIHNRVLDLPYGFMFNKSSYLKYYDQIIEFLGLNGRLICFDYVKYYLSMQDKNFKDRMITYSEKLCYK